ncbi:peptidoglycan editing factor PgeF [Gilvimarinus sp. F26214L]|uniref:peptidoglycan editing factor PgeF n=1 Tax=Gilvimarinus sp. DZF01 TaxID=3461371 RepID=UPI00404687EC
MSNYLPEGDSSARGFRPDWPAPSSVQAFISYRNGGCSEAPYASNNLGDHVGDQPARVEANRSALCAGLGISRPCWLQQVHGTAVVEAGDGLSVPEADASISRTPGRACVVLTADCLPLLLCDTQGRQVAAVHCGWRGLADGIIARTLEGFSESSDVLAFLGPAISARHYEVGPEVRDALTDSTPANPKLFSRPSERSGHFMLDLYAVARAQLQALGVVQVYGGDRCTFDEPQRFYSYRRDGTTGRMASLIWLT